MKHIGIVFFGIAFLLTKLNGSAQTPQFQWAKNVGGTGIDFANDVAVDFFGNVYTVGRFEGTADFDPGSGVFDITSTGSNDIFVLKQDAAGNFLWAKTMGSTGDDIGNAITVDITGNVYVTGYFQGTADFDPNAGVTNLTSAGSFDIFVCKLKPNGDLDWAKRMGGTGGDIGNSIALNGIDKVIFTGFFNNTADFDPGTGTTNLISSGGNNIFVSKLKANGDLDWAHNFSGTGASQGISIAMGIFSGIEIAQPVYITGRYEATVDFDPGAATVNLTPVGDDDIFILAMRANGNFDWARSIGSSTDDIGLGINSDPIGNILLAGSYSGTADFDPDGVGVFNLTPTTGTDDDIFVLKLDDTGAFIWAKSMGGSNGDEANAVTVDASGNVYTSGYFEGTANFDPTGTFNLTTNGSRDVFISKLDGAGNFVWAGAAGSFGLDISRGIAVDMSNNIFSCGSFAQTVDFDPGPGTFDVTYTGTAGNSDGYILKLNPASTTLPTITSFAPAADLVGRTVTITGTNFSTIPSDNSVQFNGVAAYIVSSTSTTLTVIVPPGASTGVIAVTVSGNTANSATNFNVVPFSCPPIAPTSGDLDIAFDPAVQSAVSFSAVSLQSTGKIIVAAPAVTIAGSNYEGILRFNEDGTLDAGFTTSLLYPSAQQLLVLPDDKIIGVVNGEPNAYISRLNDDGTPDGSFTGPNFDNSSTYDVIIGPLALQSDGKLLYSSTNTFDYVDDLVRLNTNGTPDLSFDTPAGFDIDANVIKQQADGKIVLAGALGVARLDEFGAIDPSFLAISMLDGVVNDLVIQPDGKIILVGTFTSIHGVPNRNIARLNSDGSVDTSFGTGNGFSLYSGAQPTVIKQTSNGSLIVAGEFISYNDVGRNRLLLLNSDGSLQCSFNPQTGPDAQLLDVAVQADGKILIVGSLTDYNGTAKNAFARVNNSISCVPASERAALIALYNSTDGDDWTNDANWLSPDESTWFGVVVTGCRVTDLVLTNNKLAGSLPTEIGDLTELQTLQLGSNLLTGSIPASIDNLTNLISLDFRGNQLSGAIPTTIGNITTLQNLVLDQNQLTGAIPNSIYSLINLKELELGGNQLSGTISSSISNLANLEALGLSTNQLTGSLPTELGNLTPLIRLQLGANQFTGNLPASIGNLVSLTAFSVFNNQLTGTVPASLANLVNLTGLGLSVNQFTGDVPAGIGLIPTLSDVSLRDNDFTSIPTFVSTSFTDLLVYGNKLNFGHLEPNIGKVGFVYAPQDKLAGGVASATIGLSLTIPFSTPGANNQYQWYKDGTLISGATSQQFFKTNAQPTDAGSYTVQITNTLVTGLTLETEPFLVTIGTTPPPVITPAILTTQIGGIITINLIPLITTSNALNVSSLVITAPPASGALASIDPTGILTIDYTGRSFTGSETLSIQACDQLGNCAIANFEIEVAGEIIVYNAISANGDDQNANFIIQYIDVFEDTKKNKVSIFSRWGDVVFEITDYNNNDRVFTGLSKNGKELPSGTYFYKIEFSSGREPRTGYLSLKR